MSSGSSGIFRKRSSFFLSILSSWIPLSIDADDDESTECSVGSETLIDSSITTGDEVSIGFSLESITAGLLSVIVERIVDSAIIVDGAGDGVRGRPFNIGSSSLKLELKPGFALAKGTGELPALFPCCSSFNDDPSMDGLSKLTEEERDRLAGWISDDIKLLTIDDAVEERVVLFGTRIRSVNRER